MADYYETLGVPHDATSEQIKKAFRERAFEFHPDRNAGNPAAEERFKQVNEAYSVLGDQDKRSQYDASGYSDTAYNASGRPGNPWGQAYDPFGDMYTGQPNGQYSWNWYGPFGSESQKNEPVSKREAASMLVRNLFMLAVGVLLFQFSLVFGIFGMLLCVIAIGKGLQNSIYAIKLLFRKG